MAGRDLALYASRDQATTYRGQEHPVHAAWFDKGRYAGNTVPHNGNTDASGFSSEERKLVFESRKILRLGDLAISAQRCRVPVAVGHYENAWITLKEKATPRRSTRSSATRPGPTAGIHRAVVSPRLRLASGARPRSAPP